MCTDYAASMPAAPSMVAVSSASPACHEWSGCGPPASNDDVWQSEVVERSNSTYSDTTSEGDMAEEAGSPGSECSGAQVPVKPPADRPAKARKPAAKSASCKPQRLCQYEHCPSPMHSSKWRVVTRTTVAGGRDWQKLLGMTLCDSCYSTYRKHGTFIRSVRTPEGWARFDHSAQAHILNKPSKKRVAPAPPRPAKRARPAPPVRIDTDVYEDAGRPKRERRPSSKLRDLYACDESEAGHDEDVSTPSTTRAEGHEHWAEEHHHTRGDEAPQAYSALYVLPYATGAEGVVEDVLSPSSDDQSLDYESDFLYSSVAPELASFGVPFAAGAGLVEPTYFMA
jgi:hypothetical protein